MTDPDVERRTFVVVMPRQPSRTEFAKVLDRRLHYRYRMVADSKGYRVLEGVEELLPRLRDDGYLLGIVTGNLEAADRGELIWIALTRASLAHGKDVRPAQCLVIGDPP